MTHTTIPPHRKILWKEIPKDQPRMNIPLGVVEVRDRRTEGTTAAHISTDAFGVICIQVCGSDATFWWKDLHKYYSHMRGPL